MNLLENASNSFLISDKKNHNQMKCVNEYSETICHSSKVREFQVNGEALILLEPLLHSVASHSPSYVDLFPSLYDLLTRRQILISSLRFCILILFEVALKRS